MTFACEVCEKTFTRQEHLDRHLRSHRQERPFLCQGCGRSFARQDLLKRHRQAHCQSDERSVSDGLSSAKSTRVTRAPTACQNCSRAKQRCTGLQPCARCETRGLHCIIKRERPGNDARDSGQSAVHIEGSEGLSEGVSEAVHRSNYSQEIRFNPGENLMSDEVLQVGNDITSAQIQMDWTTGPDIYDDGFAAFFSSIFNEEHSNIFTSPPYRPPSISFDTPYFNGSDFPSENVSNGTRQQFLNTQSTKQTTTPSISDGTDAQTLAFEESSFMWKQPQLKDNQVDTMQMGASRHMSYSSPSFGPRKYPAMSEESRDKVIMAITHSHMRGPWGGELPKSWPSLDFFTSMMDKFFEYFHPQYPIIHLSRFDPNNAHPALLANIIGAGALCSHINDAEIRRFAMGMLELGRRVLQHSFESDNRNIRSLEQLQSFFINIVSISWSGKKRNVELAEAFSGSIVAMTRRSDLFRHYTYDALSSIMESPLSLDAKWSKWSLNEQRKRLVYAYTNWHAQLGLCVNVPPTITYSELELPLTHGETLWTATSSALWADQATFEVTKVETFSADRLREVSFRDLSQRYMNDMISDSALNTALNESPLLHGALLAALQAMVFANRNEQDLFESNFSLQVVSHQRSSQLTRVSAKNLSLYARRGEVSEMLERLRGTEEYQTENKNFSQRRYELLHHLISLHSYASLSRIQKLAGREDKSESKIVLPGLLRWKESEESRFAVYHAGRILRSAVASDDSADAERFHPYGGSYSDTLMWAPIAVFQAALVLWTFSLLHHVSAAAKHIQSISGESEVLLDLPWSKATEYFVHLRAGRPGLSASILPPGNHEPIIFLDNPGSVALFCTDIMKKTNWGGELAEDLEKVLQRLSQCANNVLQNMEQASPLS